MDEAIRGSVALSKSLLLMTWECRVWINWRKEKSESSRISECWRRTRVWLFSVPFGRQLGHCYPQAVLILGDDCILTSDFRSDCRRSPRVCLDSLPCILGPLTVSGRLLLERYDTRCWAFLLLRGIHSQGAFITPSRGQFCPTAAALSPCHPMPSDCHRSGVFACSSFCFIDDWSW